jgi:hypothetical protein
MKQQVLSTNHEIITLIFLKETSEFWIEGINDPEHENWKYQMLT